MHGQGMRRALRAFDGAGRILLTNHAPVTGLALRKFSIVDVEVGDAGAPLFKP